MNQETESFQYIAKKTTKDSVFRDLFENPKYLLQLYKALHQEELIIESESAIRGTLSR